MKKVFISILFVLAFILVYCKSGNTQKMINNSSVKELELQRYIGTWYEIARFPHSFEKNLVGVTATYSLTDHGTIKVTNRGYKESMNGMLKEATAKAYIPNKLEPGKLKVAFFLFFYVDYFVMELDPQYQWALIGGSSPNYLWILCRNPHMDETIYNMLVEKARLRGYHIENLVRVPQS